MAGFLPIVASVFLFFVVVFEPCDFDAISVLVDFFIGLLVAVFDEDFF